MAENKKNSITVQKVAKNYDKGLAVFGGMAAGKVLSHFLNKAITSPSVKGLLGIELAENVSKFAKPLIVTGTGLTAFAMAKNQHVKYAGIGCAGIGMSDLVSVATGKNYLEGLNGAYGFGNQDFEIIDINSQQAIAPAPSLDLPELMGVGMGADTVIEDDYENAYVEDANTDKNVGLDVIEELETA